MGEMPADDSLWVFGYGSLIWDPGFAYAERCRARLSGWRRSFCMHSIHYRGTVAAPGLVLALDAEPDGVCEGVVYRVAPDRAAGVEAYLSDREMVSYAYNEARLPVALEDGRRVMALTFVVNHDHSQYAGHLPPEEQARIIAERAGERGPNADYLFSTAAHLHALGIPDPDLDQLAERVRALRE